MAEIVGVVASGIAIGQVIASITASLIKLKQLWGEIRDVPDDLMNLVNEIEVICLILAESEDQEQLSPYAASSRSFGMALQLTNNAAQELKSLVADLQTRIIQSKRWRNKIAVTKAILERDQINRLQSRLNSCIRLLTLAQNCKITTILNQQPDFLLTWLTEMAQVNNDTNTSKDTNLSAPQPDHGKDCIRRVDTSKDKRIYQIKFRIFQQQWHLYSRRSRAGWDFGFRIFTLIFREDNIPLVRAIQDDNTQVLQEMLRSGKLSPLTAINIGGERYLSLLGISVAWGSPEVARLLFNEGARVVEETLNSSSSLVWLFSAASQSLGCLPWIKNYSEVDTPGSEERLDSLLDTLLRDPELGIEDSIKDLS
ncbi:hypothetical protein F5884DRAFT_848747 [Xylogone sp. PMI_703]|nr:hypothetical protein F5884DRAFT_848747 [Xylogone sp. PMI_703]